MLYLCDFAPGQTYAGGPVTVETDEVLTFANRYDPQYFHTDPEAAKSSLFGGLASSGWMTAALTMRMLVSSGMDIAGGMIGREVEKLGWPRPTYPGDVLRVLSEVLDVLPSRSRPDRGMIRVRTDTFNQRDEIVQSMTTLIVVPNRVSEAAIC